MSTAEKQEIPESSPETQELTSTEKVANAISGLEHRLSKLIDQEVGRDKISFGFVVLMCVAQGQYERALKELECVGEGFEEYPAFEIRSRRFVEHAKGLVSAIQTKHKVGKSPHVNRAKQKELSDKIAEHFIDLKKTLIVIEKVQKSVRSKDLGSTVLLFRTCFFSLVFIFVSYTIYQNSIYSDTFTFRDLLELFTFQWPD